MPPAPTGKAYQVWVVTAQAPVSAGLLTTDPTSGGTQHYVTPPDIAPPVAVAVTLELDPAASRRQPAKDIWSACRATHTGEADLQVRLDIQSPPSCVERAGGVA